MVWTPSTPTGPVFHKMLASKFKLTFPGGGTHCRHVKSLREGRRRRPNTTIKARDQQGKNLDLCHQAL